jgi:general secretion pathway protein G
MRTRCRSRRAFTLMEVLLVLAILVILGSLVGVGYLRIQQNANKEAAKAQIMMLEEAVQHYALAVGTLPSDEQGLNALRFAPAELKNPAKWSGPYLEKEIPADPWGGAYQYQVVSQGNVDPTMPSFRIWSNGPDGQNGTEDDIDPTRDRQLAAQSQ